MVLSAWVPLLFPQLDNVSALRAVRALRPLRTINRLPGMRAQVRVHACIRACTHLPLP